MSASPKSHESDLGRRLRQLRSARGLSVRELARRAGCSASLVSQVERGLTTPSAGVVYSLANELGISLDLLFGSEELLPEDLPAQPGGVEPAPYPFGGGSWGRAEGDRGLGILQRAGERHTIELSTGVRWERLTPRHDSRVDFLDVVYEPHGRSSDNDRAVRHDGREYLRVLEGEIEAVIGFETLQLAEGDSLAFDPTVPHLYRNPTPRTARCLSVVVHDQH
ncbi:helix-turn-helix domain-containing protein [Pseudonocardia sp. RS010]|uniref:helix-turn-helix domain-containing protein n=1 Tax=Pseudonocardia sp. RS010 TaxID=3385979 RepID=UPI0039A0B39F